MSTGIIFYFISFILLGVSFIRDRKKTEKALIKAYKSFMNLIPALLPMVLFVGLLLTFVTPELIGKILGKDAGIFGVIIGLFIGSVSFIPSFVAFPLGGTLIENGAGYPQVAAFLSSAMAVGIASIVVEMKYFNKKMTILRNGMALIGSLIFATVIGWVM